LVTVNGRRYAEHRAPLQEVGALLDAKAVHTGRSARNHLRAMAATHGLAAKRVDEVIEMTGLGSVADKRVGGFSLGMGQRLGIASALLGDPQTLILDEPVNGLDPEGVLWVRNLTKYLASQGRTVFLSSHLMSEMAQTADHLIVVGRGRVLADAPVADVIAGAQGSKVRVRSPRADRLEELLRRSGATVTVGESGLLEVGGSSAEQVGDVAASAGLPLHELTPVGSSLEDAYLQLTAEEVEYHSTPVRPENETGAELATQGASRRAPQSQPKTAPHSHHR
jgi:ABC-2 type transport system ATP-binding protein